jgi:hypothetical protein
MTTISPTRKLVTLINVFTVEPGNQERLLDLLARATEIPCGTRRVSLRRACIAASMGQRSRCTPNGAAWKITRRCAGTLRRCPIFSRRSQSQSLIRECTKSSRLSPELQRNRFRALQTWPDAEAAPLNFAATRIAPRIASVFDVRRIPADRSQHLMMGPTCRSQFLWIFSSV